MFGSSSGIALSYFTPKMMFLFFAILRVLQFCTTMAIPKKSLKLPKADTNILVLSSIHKQIKELSYALCMPKIFCSIIWFSISYSVIPFLFGAMFFYQTEVLRLDSSVIDLSMVFGQVVLLAWSMAHNKYFKTTPARKNVLAALQFVIALIMLSDVLSVQGVYRTAGIPDSIYTIVFLGLLEGLMLFKVLPFSVLVAKLCPAGCEGSAMAFVMSALALANIISGYLGVALDELMGSSICRLFLTIASLPVDCSLSQHPYFFTCTKYQGKITCSGN